MAVRNTRPTARRRNRRRWRAATALTPTLLLVAASSTLLSLPPPTVRDGRAESSPDGGGIYGASGHLPRTREPGTQVLDLAGRPQRMPGPPDDAPRGRLDIPEPMMAAYVGAADRLAESHPGCGVHWSVLASIGRIESGHARGGHTDVNGTTISAILGPRLSGGPGVAAIPDTDGGSLDGDPVWDRAVGAMQFIPGTWNKYALDGNDDGELSPHNVHDAAATSGAYLCAGDTDLREPRALAEAVFRYNHSDDYVRTVLRWADAYAGGAFPLPQEPLPEVDGHDVLAGSRLPAAQPERPVPAPQPADLGSGASALTPPSVAGAPPEPAGDVRPTWPGASGEPVDAEPQPGSDAVRPPEADGPETASPADTRPTLPPGSSEPPSDAAPPQGGTPSTERPPSAEVPPPSAPPTSGDAPPSSAPPASGDAPPPGPGHSSDAPPSDGVPPSDPPASEAPSSTPPPASGPPTSTPGSATTAPPGTHQPEPSGSQPVPPAPAGSAPPPSGAPQPAPSSESPGTGPATTAAPASEPVAPPALGSPSTQPSTRPEAAPSTRPGASSTQPSTPVTSAPASDSSVPARCEVSALNEGRFVPRSQAEAADTRLESGTTDPHTAVPGEVVFVESATSGPLGPCEVPADFKPAS